MAQPNANGVLAAYELLVNTQMKSAESMGRFGERIQNQANEVGKTAIAYHQAQKDNEFRDKAHSDDVALKKEGLAIDNKNAESTRINALANKQDADTRQRINALSIYSQDRIINGLKQPSGQTDPKGNPLSLGTVYGMEIAQNTGINNQSILQNIPSSSLYF